jgi:arsenate reductase
MAEAGIDLAGAVPKAVEPLLDEPWDLVVTVCDQAREVCPAFPRRVEQTHVSFEDPSFVPGDEEERMRAFRRTRDEIRARLIPEIEKRGRG